jgi:hypothetical protein
MDSLTAAECYGLHSIELRRRPSSSGSGTLLLGRYQSPGQIVLYEQPVPPWRLGGALPHTVNDDLVAAGASVDTAANGAQTIVWWPGTTLRDFILLDVLLHEIGHHTVQHESRRPFSRVRRTRDHENGAATVAVRLRRRLGTAETRSR